ncbi:MAG: fimbria/pilus periplasmic chaperone [Rectinema sp.]|nr:fimbria/pilus periplasmic chaperone [Rectinema sp.]
MRKTIRLIAVASFLLAATLGFSFTFMPMSISISPSGAQSIANFRLTNDSSQQIAIVIKAMTRQIDEFGNETNEPADKDFAIFPARVVVQPNSFQNIKVQYKGTQKLSNEVPYRIIAEQVPIDFSAQQSSGVKVLFRYIAALYVTPPKVDHKVEVVKVEYGEKDGTPGFVLTLRNSGTRHALLNDPVLKVTSASMAIFTIKGDDAAALQGQNLLPGNTRRFFIPWKDAKPGTTYTATLSATIE